MSNSAKKLKQVGQIARRIDGLALVKGKPVFADDLHLANTLYLKVLHSPHAHARIKSINSEKALAIPGVILILTHADFPVHYYTTAGQGYPEPSPRDIRVLDDTVRFVGDRVAVVAAETVEAAELALQQIEVDYEILPANFDPERSGEAPVLHGESGKSGIHDFRKNIASYFEADLGDAEKGFGESEWVFEGRYSTPYVQQASVEPHISLSWLDENERLIIRTSTQVPFHVRRIVAEVLNFPLHKIRVIKPRVGGAFGGKQEILNEELVAAVTIRTGRPARLEFTRAEELYAARSRHPQIVTFKIGINADHTIHAIDMNILENCGAYGPHALTVMSVTAQKSLTLYRSPNVHVEGKAVYTNLPVAGAYRGYGAPQGFFALECLMDEIAVALAIDPIEFRHKNYVLAGEDVPIAKILGEGREGFPVVIESTGMRECLETGRKLIGWDAIHSMPKSGIHRRGVGMACVAQGSGIAGIDMGSVFIKMNEDGSFNLLMGATDLGTGSDTALAQIAAEVLEVPLEKIMVTSSDTDITPFDTGAYASSTTFISGAAVKKAAERVRSQILEQGLVLLGEKTGVIQNGFVTGMRGGRISYGDICTRSFYTENQRQIMATASHVSYDSPPPFNATFADVTVDTETGIVSVNKIVSVTDAGQIINPQMAEGQVEGAIPQSLGMALSEYMIFDESGQAINTNFGNYHIFTAIDMPKIIAKFIATHEPSGPFGAKAVAEIPINGPAPAVANAIFNACGVRVRDLPITPEKIVSRFQS